MFTNLNAVIDFCTDLGLTSTYPVLPFWDYTYNGEAVTSEVVDGMQGILIDFDKLPVVFRAKPNAAYTATNMRSVTVLEDYIAVLYSVIDTPDYVENNDPLPEYIEIIFIDDDPNLAGVVIDTTILVIGDDVYYNFNGVQVNISECVRNGSMSANEAFALCGIILNGSKFSTEITQDIPAIIPPAPPEQECIPDQIDTIYFDGSTDLLPLLAKTGSYSDPTYLSYVPLTLIPVTSDINPIDLSDYTERANYLIDPPKWCLSHNNSRWMPASSMNVVHNTIERHPRYKLRRVKESLTDVGNRKIRQIYLRYNFEELYSQMRCNYIDNFSVTCLKVVLEGIDYLPDSLWDTYEPFEYTAYVAVYESHHSELVTILKQYMQDSLHGFDDLASYAEVYVPLPVNITIEYFKIPNCTLTLNDLVAIIPSDENTDNAFSHWEWSGLDDSYTGVQYPIFGTSPIRFVFSLDWAKYTSTSRGYAVHVIYELLEQKKIEDIYPKATVQVNLTSYTTFVKFNLFSRFYGYFTTVIEEKIIYPRKVYLESVEIIPDYNGKNGYSSITKQGSSLSLVYSINEDTLNDHTTGYNIVFNVTMNDALYPNMKLKFNFIDSSGLTFSYVTDQPLIEVDLGLMRNRDLNITVPITNIMDYYNNAPGEGSNSYVRNLYYVPNNN